MVDGLGQTDACLAVRKPFNEPPALGQRRGEVGVCQDPGERGQAESLAAQVGPQRLREPPKARLGLTQVSGDEARQAEIRVGRNGEREIAERLSQRQPSLGERARAGRFPDQPEVLARVHGHPPEPPPVVEAPGELLGLPKTLGDLRQLAEHIQRCPQLEEEVDRLLPPLATVRESGQRRPRLLQAGHRLAVGRAGECLGPGLPEVRDRLLPHLASPGVVGQPLDVFGQPAGIGALDGADDGGVEGVAPVLEQGAVGDFMGERMLEGVLGIREEPCLVEKLGRLQMREPPMYRFLRRLRHGVEQHERHVLANDRSRLEQPLVFGREPVDPGRQDHLHGRRDLDCLDGPGQTIGAAFPGEHTRLHERPDALLDEKGIAASDQKPLERLQPRVVTQEGTQELARTLGRERVEPELAVVGFAPPAVLVLGPVVDEQEEPGRGQTLDQAIEQGLRLGIDPVQVLEDHEERLPLALPEQEVLDGVEGALAALGGIERLPVGVFDRHIKEG